MASSTSCAALMSVYTALLACVMWVPIGQRAEFSKRFVVKAKTLLQREKSGGGKPEITSLGSTRSAKRVDRRTLSLSVKGIRRPCAAASSEQLGDIGRVECIALVAELAVDHHLPGMLAQQQFGIGLP